MWGHSLQKQKRFACKLSFHLMCYSKRFHAAIPWKTIQLIGVYWEMKSKLPKQLHFKLFRLVRSVPELSPSNAVFPLPSPFAEAFTFCTVL